MAFRLRPLHEDTLQFAGLSNTQILILALEASQKLEWNIEELTLEGVRFDVPMSVKSHGEEITVSIQEGSDGEISVRSQSIAMQLWQEQKKHPKFAEGNGRNKINSFSGRIRAKSQKTGR